MLAMPKTVETGPTLSPNASSRNLTGDEERADLNMSGQLHTVAGHHDFAPGDFVHPARAWRPPYPYALDECPWTRP